MYLELSVLGLLHALALAVLNGVPSSYYGRRTVPAGFLLTACSVLQKRERWHLSYPASRTSPMATPWSAAASSSHPIPCSPQLTVSTTATPCGYPLMSGLPSSELPSFTLTRSCISSCWMLGRGRCVPRSATSLCGGTNSSGWRQNRSLMFYYCLVEVLEFICFIDIWNFR